MNDFCHHSNFASKQFASTLLIHSRLVRLISFFQIITIFASSSLFAFDFQCMNFELSECKNSCDSYTKSANETKYEGSCPPDTSGQYPLTLADGTTYTNADECQNGSSGTDGKAPVSGMFQRWGDLGQLCDSIKLLGSAATFELATAAALSAAAAVCLYACIKPEAVNMITVCSVLTTVAAATDVADTIFLEGQGRALMKNWEALVSPWFAGLAPAANIGGTYYYNRSNKGGAQSKGGAAESSAESKGGAAESGAESKGGAAESGAESKGGAEGGESKNRASCAAAALAAAAAGFKWASYFQGCSAAKDNCDKASSLMSMPSTLPNRLSPDTPLSNANSSSSAKNSLSQISQNAPIGQNNTNSNKSNLSGGGGTSSQDLGSLIGTSQATAEMSPLFAQFPDYQTTANTLKNLGIDPSQFVNSLRTQSPSTALQNLFSGAPEPVKAGLRMIDDMVKEGKLSLQSQMSASSSFYSSGGAGGGGAKSKSFNPFGNLGQKNLAASGSATAQQIQIDGKSLNISSNSSSDIWHSKWKGTIFEIISTKLTSNLPRIDALEWVTPLNRALMGLPPKPTSDNLTQSASVNNHDRIPSSVKKEIK